MKADSFSVSTSFTSLALKLAGVVVLLGALTDYFVLAVPANFLNHEWLSSFIGEIVNRGTIPLLGIALLFFGVWVGRQGAPDRVLRSSRLLSWLVWLSALLGVMFLIFAPLYFNSNRLASASITRRINEEAVLAEAQLNNVLAQQRDRIGAILSDDAQLAQLQQELQQQQLAPEQQAQLREVQETLRQAQTNPQLLDQRVEEARTQALTQIQQQQQEAQAQVRSEMRKARIRVVSNSLLLAIGYLIITWTGMGMAGQRQRSSKPKAKSKPKNKPSSNRRPKGLSN